MVFLICIQGKIRLQESIKGKIIVMLFLQFRFFLFLIFVKNMLSMKRKDIHCSFQEERTQLVLHSILTYVCSLASTPDEWCGLMLQHKFCAQQGCAQAMGTNVLNVRGMRFKVVLWSNFYSLIFWVYHIEFHERIKTPFTVRKYPN